MHKHFLVWVVVMAAIFIAALLGISSAEADGPSTWTNNTQLYLTKVTDASPNQIPPSFFANDNIECSFVYDDDCSVETPYGSVYDSSLWVDGKWIPIKDYGNNTSNYLAVPNSDTAITFSNSPVEGVYLYFTSNASLSLSPQYVLRPGETNIGALDKLLLDHFKINVPPDRSLADRSSNRLAADLNSMSFSANSEWMVVTKPDITTMRVNVNNGAVLPFGTGFTYGLGQNPMPKTAITSDGRYAVIASLDSSVFTIYDLSTCGPVPENITKPVDCQSKDLMISGFMQQQIPGYMGIRSLRFLDDDTISFYASYKDGVTTKYGQYLLSINPGPTTRAEYLALGDSYISGEGAYRYLAGTDTSDNQCHVSLGSYPLLLGSELNYNSYHSVACSGATTNDLIRSDKDYAGQVRSGLNRNELEKEGQIKKIITNFQQGYIDQLDFVKQYRPKVITVSIGGNDIGFSARLQSCLGTGTCYSTYEDRLELVNEINSKFSTLFNTYTKIKNAGAADAKIYVIGYPQIAKTDGNCAENVHMNKDELAFAEQTINYLDTVIKHVAAKAGVFYVDMQDAFYGHRLCEAGPGSIAMNGISAGNDFPDKLNGPIARESYHPNAYGHQLLEARILSQTHNMTDQMPAANPAASIPTNASQAILNAPHSNRDIKTTEYDNSLSDDLIYRGVPSAIIINGANHSLAAGTQLQAEIHSTPLLIGSYTSGPGGNLTAQITIPGTVPTGYHSLHFYGNDVANQPVDIYKVIYLAGSVNDVDGNGVKDSIQECIGVEASGQDADRDDIDDACDGSITAPTPMPGDSNISGTISANTSSLEIVSSQPQTAASAQTPLADYSSAQSAQSNQPVVLSSTIQKNPASSFAQTDNLRLPVSDFLQTGAAIFLMSSLAYVIKSAWI